MSAPSGFVGQSVQRREDWALLNGSGRFVADINRPGQVWARIVRSPISSGAIISIDKEAALGHEGVLAVITAEDIPDVKIPLRLAETAQALVCLQPALAGDAVRYVGEPLAVVVAESPHVAEDGADSLRIEIREDSPMLDAVKAAQTTSSMVHPALGTNIVNRDTAVYGGDVADLLEHAPVVVSEKLHVHRHTAMPLETRGLLAEFGPADASLTVWGAAKVKHFNRRALAGMLDLPESAIRLVESSVGGSFGVRGEFYPEDFLIPWLAVHLGRPVKWVEDRSEHFVATNHSREHAFDITLAATRDGQLIALQVRSWCDLGAYVRTNGGMLTRLAAMHLPGPYTWAACDIEVSAVLTNKTPAGTYRGPGIFEVTFARERMLDRLARELDMDPCELRRRNLVPAESMPLGLDLGGSIGVLKYESGDYPAIWAGLQERADYDEIREAVDRRRALGECVGVGVSAFLEVGGIGPYEQAWVVPQEDGTFDVRLGVASVGQGVETALAQICADALGVQMERVRVQFHDTDAVPEGFGAFASRTTVLGGNAILAAVQDLGDKARAEVARRHTVPETDVEVDGGCVRILGDETHTWPLADLGCSGEGRFDKAVPSFSMGGTVAVVGIDRETGHVAVEQLFVAYDVGRMVNPAIVRGQLVGAAAQGIAGTLLEELVYDEAGQLVTTSFMDYLLPTATDVPPIEAVVFEYPVPSNPLELKGCGEGGIIGTGGAIANAVADALGADGRCVTRLPLSPNRVWNLIQASDH